MHDFQQGKLESNGGGRVRNPRQAVAIALSEASNRTSTGGATREKLYARAREANG